MRDSNAPKKVSELPIVGFDRSLVPTKEDERVPHRGFEPLSCGPGVIQHQRSTERAVPAGNSVKHLLRFMLCTSSLSTASQKAGQSKCPAKEGWSSKKVGGVKNRNHAVASGPIVGPPASCRQLQLRRTRPPPPRETTRETRCPA